MTLNLPLLNIWVGLANLLVATLAPATFLPLFARVVLLAAGMVGIGMGAFCLAQGVTP